jgi:predicted component of type VI protein secretion system
VELRAFLAELQGLRPDLDSPATPEFDHDAPGPALHELYLRIRQLIAGAVSVRYREVPFEMRDRVLVAALTREELSQPCEFMLAMDSPLDAKEVADFVEDRARFKVMSPSTAFAAVPGVKVLEERAPVGLPVRDKRHFFRLYANADPPSSEMWKRIVGEGGVVVLNWRELQQHQARKELVPTLFVVRSSQRQGTS